MKNRGKSLGLLQLGVWTVCGGEIEEGFLTYVTRRAGVRCEEKGRVTTVRNDGGASGGCSLEEVLPRSLHCASAERRRCSGRDDKWGWCRLGTAIEERFHRAKFRALICAWRVCGEGDRGGIHRANFARLCRDPHLRDPARRKVAKRRPGHCGSLRALSGQAGMTGCVGRMFIGG